MNAKNPCACESAPRLIFACSGAADVGALSDQAARKLTRDGNGRMFCLAGIGGRIQGIMETTRSASKILVIDGCSLNCARQALEQAGFTSYVHLNLADLGLEKGKSSVTAENIEVVVARGAVLLA